MITGGRYESSSVSNIGYKDNNGDEQEISISRPLPVIRREGRLLRVLSYMDVYAKEKRTQSPDAFIQNLQNAFTPNLNEYAVVVNEYSDNVPIYIYFFPARLKQIEILTNKSTAQGVFILGVGSDLAGEEDTDILRVDRDLFLIRLKNHTLEFARAIGFTNEWDGFKIYGMKIIVGEYYTLPSPEHTIPPTDYFIFITAGGFTPDTPYSIFELTKPDIYLNEYSDVQSYITPTGKLGVGADVETGISPLYIRFYEPKYVDKLVVYLNTIGDWTFDFYETPDFSDASPISITVNVGNNQEGYYIIKNPMPFRKVYGISITLPSNDPSVPNYINYLSIIKADKPEERVFYAEGDLSSDVIQKIYLYGAKNVILDIESDQATTYTVKAGFLVNGDYVAPDPLYQSSSAETSKLLQFSNLGAGFLQVELAAVSTTASNSYRIYAEVKP